MPPSWLHSLDTCPSTNTWALTHLDRLTDGAVVFTRRQTAGRGQYDRRWVAPAGVLTASFVLDRLAVQAGFSLAAGLAVIYAIEDLLPDLKDQLRLKWPNDVWLQDRKLAGILCEATSINRGDGGNEANGGSSSDSLPNAAADSDKNSAKMQRLVVGVGLNRAVDFAASGVDPSSIGDPISLHQVVSTVPDELDCLSAIRHYLRQASSLCGYAHPAGLGPLLPELRRRDALQGRSIALSQPPLSGIASGIDAQGRLLIEQPDRTIQAVSSGSISLIDKE